MSASSPRRRGRWADETYQGIVSTAFRLKRRLFAGKSAFQRVEVVETAGHGRMLFNDGMAMLSERDEFVYHEMMAHVPLFAHPAPRRVLVIGGGDGGTVREVLRHRSIERCVLVEIDGMVVDACRRYIPSTASALSDPRVEVRIEDGAKFVRETRERFDAVMVDSTEPFGPATPLFGARFYAGVRRLLTRDGVVVSQAGSPFYEPVTVESLARRLRPIFAVVRPFLFTNLTYPGGLWAFTFASKGLDPVRALDERRVTSARLPTRWYNADVHRASFALPEFVRRAIAR